MHDRSGVFQICQFFHSLRDIRLRKLIDPHSLFHQCTVNHNAAVVDLFRQVILVPYSIRHWIIPEPLLDLHFHFYISAVVLLEQFPFFRGVLWKIPLPSLHPARCTEKTDQVTPLFHFLMLQTQHGSYLCKRQWKAVVGCKDKVAAPGDGREVVPFYETTRMMFPQPG